MIALQVRAESAAASAAVAEAAQAANQIAEDNDTDHAAELYQQAHRARTEASSLQEAVQRALQNTDDIEATAALLCSTDEQDEGASTAQAGCDASGTSETHLPLLYNVQALQLWLLKCCQAAKGGMRDKPGKPPDYYHTCYCLSGLSSSQNFGGLVLGPESNKLVKADPFCNVVQHKLDAALQFVPVQPEYL